MERPPPLLPTPPADLKLRDTDAVESCAPPERPLETDASGSCRPEPNSPPSIRRRAGRSRSPTPSKARRQSRSPVRRSRPRSPTPSKARRRSRSRVRRSRSRSPTPSKARRRSRSPPPSPSKYRHRPRSPSPSKYQRRSRSLSPSKYRRRSRSPSPSKYRRRSRSPSPSKYRRRSRSPSPSKYRRRSRSPSPSKYQHRSRSPPPSKAQRRSKSPSPSKYRHRSRSPPPSKARRRSRSPPPSKGWSRTRSPPPSKARRRSRSPLPSKARRRSRSPKYISVTQHLAELEHAKRPSAGTVVEGERVRPSSLDESSVENRPSSSHNNWKAPSRNAHRKKMKIQIQAEVKKGMREAPSRNGPHKKMKREKWAEAKKEFREMKKDKLLENIKKLQSCVWLLEKDGADMAEIMEFRSLLESTKKQYVENEAQLAKEGSSAPLQVLKRERLEKTPVETTSASVEKVESDEQNMDSGKVEGRSLKGCEALSEENELAEEVNRLKSELETIKQDRDYQLAQAQSLMADVAKQKEVARRYGVELEDAMRRAAALEEGCLLERETIKALQIQLASANMPIGKRDD